MFDVIVYQLRAFDRKTWKIEFDLTLIELQSRRAIVTRRMHCLASFRVFKHLSLLYRPHDLSLLSPINHQFNTISHCNLGHVTNGLFAEFQSRDECHHKEGILECGPPESLQ